MLQGAWESRREGQGSIAACPDDAQSAACWHRAALGWRQLHPLLPKNNKSLAVEPRQAKPCGACWQIVRTF